MTTPTNGSGAQLPPFRRVGGTPQPQPAPAPPPASAPVPPAPAPQPVPPVQPPQPAPAPANRPAAVPPPPGMRPAGTPIGLPAAAQPAPVTDPPLKADTETSDWILMVIGLVLPWCCLLYLGVVPSGIAALWAAIKIKEHKKANRQPPTLLTVTFWVSLVIMIPLGILSFVWFTAFGFLTSN